MIEFKPVQWVDKFEDFAIEAMTALEKLEDEAGRILTLSDELEEWWSNYKQDEEIRKQNRYEEIIMNLSDDDIEMLKERFSS